MELLINFLNSENSDREKLAVSCLEDLKKKSAEKDNLLILENIYNDAESVLSEEEQCMFCVSILFCGTNEEKEKALLNSYYLVSKDNQDGIRLLSEYCRDAEHENDEKLRGRKHWIRLVYLHRLDDDNQAIEDYIRRMKETEKSPYVWERVFAALISWNESFRIYPEVSGWKEITGDPGEAYERFSERAQSNIDNAYRYKNGIERSLPRLISLAAEDRLEAEELYNIISAAAEQGSPFPLSEEQFISISAKGSRHQHVLVYLINKYYSTASDLKAASKLLIFLNNIQSTNNALYPKYVWSVLSAIEYIENRSSISPEDFLFSILRFDMGEGYDRSEIYQSVSDDLGKILLYMAANKLLDKKYIEDLVNLLDHKSPYYQALASTTLLQAYRSEYDITQYKDRLLKFLENMPFDKNGLATGHDIKPEEYEYSSKLTNYTQFLPPEADEDRDEFFSVGKLTGLLAQCQPPKTSHRIALLLKELALNTNDFQLLNQLKPLGEFNSVLGSLDMPSPDKQMQLSEDDKNNAQNFISSLTQFGPFTLDEILDLFKETAALNTLASDKLLEAGRERQMKKEEEYVPGIQMQQRNLIKSVFEGLKEEAVNNNPLRDIFFERRYGKKHQEVIKFSYNENTADYFALYVDYFKQNGELNPFYGIYFNGFTCLNAIKHNSLDIELFLRTIVIHELFHSHIDFTLKEKKPVYTGPFETPGRLEEAAANRMALDWLVNKNNPDPGKGKIKEILFDNAVNHNIPGYGEYELLDSRAAEVLPVLFADKNKTDTMPAEYMLSSLDKFWGLNPEKKIIRENWENKAETFGDNIIPFYFDLS